MVLCIIALLTFLASPPNPHPSLFFKLYIYEKRVLKEEEDHIVGEINEKRIKAIAAEKASSEYVIYID